MEWVQVQSGLGQGLWLHLDLASERNWWLGKHEPGVQEELQQLLAPDIVVYDVGAHIGFHALAAARHGAQVIAFEPDPDNAVRLRLHVERNGLAARIRVVEAAVWSEVMGTIIFRRGLPRSQGGVASGSHRPVLASGETITVPACNLDEFVERGAPAPHVVKIDVEGGESEVLRGATDILRTHRPLLLVEVHTAAECERVTAILESASYETRWAVPPEAFPRQCFATPRPDRAQM